MHKSTPLFLLLLLSLTTSVINNTIDIIHDYRYSGPYTTTTQVFNH